MRTIPGQARGLWRRLVDGFWLVPGSVAAAYILLAMLLTAVDRSFGRTGLNIAFKGDANAARVILSTIATSLITVAGVAFSLTIVVLTLVSAQFTTRAVRSFLADRVNQVVAGAFVGNFAYCLLILRSVRGREGDGGPFIPSLSVSVSVALGLLALGLLLKFIHHMGESVQGAHITVRIARATLKGIDEVYQEPYNGTSGDGREDLLRSWYEEAEPARVFPGRPGYVQMVSFEEILDHFEDHRIRLHVAVRAGDFVTERTTLAALWPGDAANEEAVRALRRSIVVAHERDLRQDPAYGMRQLADIALKGLSPAINDPTTAVTCIGYLRAALERLVERETPEVERREHHGVTLLAMQRSFDEDLEVAFGEIAHYAAANRRVVDGTLRALLHLVGAAQAAGAYERLLALESMAGRVAELALAQTHPAHDRRAVEEALRAVEAEIASVRESELDSAVRHL